MPHDSSPLIQVRVLFFAYLRDRFQAGEKVYSLPRGSRLKHLSKQVLIEAGQSELLARPLAYAVNMQYCGLETPLEDGDEVALIPPVAGGAI